MPKVESLNSQGKILWE